MEQNTSIIFTSCKTNTNIVKCHSLLAGDLLTEKLWLFESKISNYNCDHVRAIMPSMSNCK